MNPLIAPDLLKAQRVYTKKEVYTMLALVMAHGRYDRLLRREGIEPVKTVQHGDGTKTTFYPADKVDDLVKDIKA